MEAKVLPDSFNPGFFDALATHFVQSFIWGEVRRKTGAKVVRLGFFEDNTLKNTAQITFHTLPKVGKTIGHLARGNMLSNEELAELVKIGRGNNAIAIRIEPNCKVGEWHPTYKNLKKSSQNIFVPYNFLLDLTKSEEELLANMHPKTRYNIKVAQKHGVVVKEKTDEETLEAFIKLQKETAIRQQFFTHTDEYYRTVFFTLKTQNTIRLLVAMHPENSQILSLWFMVEFKDTFTYLYGDSSRVNAIHKYI